jgi:hypothetical protein
MFTAIRSSINSKNNMFVNGCQTLFLNTWLNGEEILDGSVSNVIAGLRGFGEMICRNFLTVNHIFQELGRSLMLKTKWNGVIFGAVLGTLLAMAGFTINASPWAVIFLLIAINVLHFLVPPTKGLF